MTQLKRFGVLQTAKVAGVLYFLGALVFCIPIGLLSMLVGGLSEQNPVGAMFGGIFMFVAPFIYGALGFVFVAIGCLVYNLTAKFVGGIEVELE